MDGRLPPGQRSQVQPNKDPSAGRLSELAANFRLLSFVVCRISQGETKTPPLCFRKHHGGSRFLGYLQGTTNYVYKGSRGSASGVKYDLFTRGPLRPCATSWETLADWYDVFLFFFFYELVAHFEITCVDKCSKTGRMLSVTLASTRSWEQQR